MTGRTTIATGAGSVIAPCGGCGAITETDPGEAGRCESCRVWDAWPPTDPYTWGIGESDWAGSDWPGRARVLDEWGAPMHLEPPPGPTPYRMAQPGKGTPEQGAPAGPPASAARPVRTGLRTRRACVAVGRAGGRVVVRLALLGAQTSHHIPDHIGSACVRGVRAVRIGVLAAGRSIWVARRARRLAHLGARVARVFWRLAEAGGRWVAHWAPIVAAYTVRAGRWALTNAEQHCVQLAVAVWRWAEPWASDACGWLVHRALSVVGCWLARVVLRFLGWAWWWVPLNLGRICVWALIALAWLAGHAVVYCVGYRDYAGVVAEAQASGRPSREHRLRKRWRRAALRRTLTLLSLAAGLAVAALMVVDRYGRLGEAGLIGGAVAVLAAIGRARLPDLWASTPREGTPQVPEPFVEDERAPYPLADARTRVEATDCLTRALNAEGIALRGCEEPRRTAWGWEIAAVLRKGTPAAIVAKTGELETHLDLPEGGVLATPDRQRRARVVLRLAHTDPFAQVGTAAARAPLSATITQRTVIGRRIDGQPLAVPLAGVHGVVIGASGAGKSGTLLALADALTACTDAIVWDLDPAGPGLEVLGGAVARRERDRAGIEDALADALALAEVRPRMTRALGMGAEWKPSPVRPALVVIVDEYSHLSNRAKELAVALLGVGRKARVALILASTEATSDALGAAIADSTALRILHACRHSDVRLVLGPRMAAEGWRPDRLRASTGDDPGDVGHCYVYTAGLTEPLVSKIAPLPEDEAVERGHQRATAGLPCIDRESWDLVQARRSDERPSGKSAAASGQAFAGPGGAAAAGARVGGALDRTGIEDVISTFDTDARLWTEEILTRLGEVDDRYAGWLAEDLAAALRPLGVLPRGIKREGTNRNGYHREVIVAAYSAWKAGERS